METKLPDIPDAGKFSRGVKVSDFLMNKGRPANRFLYLIYLALIAEFFWIQPTEHVPSPNAGIQFEPKFQLGCVWYD